MTDKIRLLIVEDHDLVRRGLKDLISLSDKITIVGEASSVKEAIEQIVATKPTVILLDMMLPDGRGIDIFDYQAFKDSQAKTLVLTSFSDDQNIFEAIKSGVNGYLLKESKSQALLQAIIDVANGGYVIDPSLTQGVFSSIKNQEKESRNQNRIKDLSAQELRVVAEVAKGLTNKEIATELNLSDKTVKNYLSNALGKLEVSRRTEAAVLYLKYKQAEFS